MLIGGTSLAQCPQAQVKLNRVRRNRSGSNCDRLQAWTFRACFAVLAFQACAPLRDLDESASSGPEGEPKPFFAGAGGGGSSSGGAGDPGAGGTAENGGAGDEAGASGSGLDSQPDAGAGLGGLGGSTDRPPNPSTDGRGGSSGSAGGTLSSPAGSGGVASPGGKSGSAGSSGSAGGSNVGGSGGASGAGGNGGAGAGSGVGTAGATGRRGCGPRPGLHFCDDFEQLPLGVFAARAPWSLDIGGTGRVTIDGSQSYSGHRSVRVDGSGFKTMLVYRSSVLPQASERLYVRLFVRLAEPMTQGPNHFLIAERRTSVETLTGLRVGEMHGMLSYTVGGVDRVLANADFYENALPGAALKAKAWSCLELLVDTRKPELAIWLDGTELVDMHRQDLATEIVESLRFGFENLSGPAAQLWLDDIAISSQPIGCY